MRPSVLTLHGLHLVRRLRGTARRAAALNLRLALRATNRAICVSEQEHQELRRVIGPLAERRAVVVRNGVEVPPLAAPSERAAVRADLGLVDSDVVAIWVGSLHAHKDPLTAVRAANRAADEGAPLQLLLVGDGPLRPEVEAAAGPCVRILGLRRDVPRLLAAADVFVLSSSREGLPFSVLEAMAAGLTPVVSDLPENREAIAETGIAVPFGNPEPFAAAFRELARDPQRRAVEGERARRRVEEHFRADEMVRWTREVYREVLEQRRDRRA
jgi:glycosyltransferase involved in cell wall biosynthesis